ncbi:MBL fold metallo-hydrolase [Mycolicibacterium llatzerense]
MLGGPTTLIEYGGLRFLVDPTFDPPSEYPVPGFGDYKMVKTEPTALAIADVGHIDAVLLSHDEHPDNLDIAGRAMLPAAGAVFTTVGGADRLGGNARGVSFWEAAEMTRPDGGTITITGVPARHGPLEAAEINGDVIGFVLTGDDLPSIYVSGDNVGLEYVTEIAAKFAPLDIAILFLGAARHAPILNNALVSMTSAEGAEAAKILRARRVVAAHFDGWAHFKEGRNDIEHAFSTAGLADQLDFAR